MNIEEQVRVIAKRHYNIRPNEEVPSHIRARIFRKFHLQDDVKPHLEGPGPLADRIEKWKRDEATAQREVEARTATPARQKSALELRLEYLESQSVDPLRRRDHERKVSEAKRELEAERAEQRQAAIDEQRETVLTSHPRYQNALENAQATANLTRDTDEYVESLVRLKQLQSANLDNLEDKLSNYWNGVMAMENREVAREQARSIEPNRIAAEAVDSAMAQEEKVIQSKYRATIAHINSQEQTQ